MTFWCQKWWDRIILDSSVGNFIGFETVVAAPEYKNGADDRISVRTSESHKRMMDVIQAELKAMKEMIEANQANGCQSRKNDCISERRNEIHSNNFPDMKDGRKKRTACQEATEANPEKMEPNPEMMQSIGEHQEVPKEEPAVRYSGALKKWHRGWNLAMERRQKLKERTQGNCGSWKKLTVAGRKMTHHTGVAWHKRNVVRTSQTRNQVKRGALKGRKDRKRLWRGPECKIGMKNVGTRLQLCLTIKRTPYGFNKKAFRLEFVKGVNVMFSGLRKVRNWIL
jgi:hypothetical protein